MSTLKSVLRTGLEPSAREAPDTSAFPSRLVQFVWRMSGWRQVQLCALAAVVAVVNLAPVELQRRIVDDAIQPRNLNILIWLSGIYAAVLLLHNALKYILMVAQSWLGESAVKHARDELIEMSGERVQDASAATAGQAVTVVGSEIDKLGGFIGESISQACVNGALLLSVAAYMAYVEPMIAAYSFAFLVPQALLTPYLQEKLNVLVARHLGLVRQLSDQISGGDQGTDIGEPSHDARQTVGSIFRNRMRFYSLKYGLKALLNLANAMGPLAVLLFGGWMAIRGETTVGTVLAFASGFERLSQPIRDLVAFYRVAAQASVQYGLIRAWTMGGATKLDSAMQTKPA